MSIVRTAVLLFAFPAGEKLNLRDAPWYVSYFFSPSHGLASYWNKQTNNNLVLVGEVFDWALVDNPNPDLSKRKDVIEFAIGAMENDRGANFDRFDIVITVIGAPPKVSSDGGSTTVNSENRSHAGIAMRVGDRFDFVAHEMGHALELNHSYGSPLFKAESWSQYGEYGHPYCIMSAMSYGGISGPFIPPNPRDNATEYTGLGPSVNAATAIAKGWLGSHSFNISPGSSAEFEICSRHLNSFMPHAIQLFGAGGHTFAIEYRENDGWDKGQGEPVLMINHGKGSSADLAHPNTSSATYIGRIRIPITLGAVGSVFNGPGFSIQVIERNNTTHSVSVRVNSWNVSAQELNMNSSFSTIRTDTVESGVTVFPKGEVLCVDGTWPYQKIANWQQGTFEVTYNAVRPPINVVWRVDDIALTELSGTITLHKYIDVAQPKLTSKQTLRMISVNYVIEILANGSRLKLFNRPADESYSLDVDAYVLSSVGTGSTYGWAKFKGSEYIYPPEFYQIREECIKHFKSLSDRYAKYKFLLPPDLWQRIPEELHEEVQDYLKALGYLIGESHNEQFQQLSEHLGQIIGEPNLRLQSVSVDDIAELNPQVGAREPQQHMQMVK